MSAGIGAVAKLVLCDETAIIYEYTGYNLNDPEYRSKEIRDGLITVL